MFMSRKGALALVEKKRLPSLGVWGKRERDGSLCGMVVEGFLDFKDPKLGDELRRQIEADAGCTFSDESREVIAVPFYDVETQAWRALLVASARVPPVEHENGDA